ncbi:MAG: hypothetical protein LBS79_05380 [Tannerella sp.]|jgi:hypothetical protein|nr:hypothetical protein [Tannerella sp.]
MSLWTDTNYKYIRYPNGGFAYIPDGNARVSDISLSMAMNYKVYKEMYFGVGIEPIYSNTLDFVNTGKTNSNQKFSIPVIYKIGADFNKADVSISNKIDFINKSKSGFLFNLLAPLK